MATCSFITATEARDIARNNTLIWTEICEVQTQILAAIDANAYSVLVNDGTPMTSIQGILTAVVTAGGSGYDPVVATADINENGTGGTLAEVTPEVTGTTITGFIVDVAGSGYEPVDVTATITDPSNLIDAQDETDYDGIAGDGTFTAGDNYFVGEVVTLSEASTITVDVIAGTSFVTIATQDESNYPGTGAPNGSFVGGDGIGVTAYVVLDTITLNDGTIIRVDAIDGNGDVTEFTVTSSSTTGRVSLSERTQISTSSSGLGFTLTTGTANETEIGTITGFTIGSPGSTPFFFPATLSQGSSTGIGTGVTITPGANNITALGGGVGGTLTPIESGGAIINVAITTAGTGYLLGAPVIFTHPNGTGATAFVSAVGTGGEILAVTITANGSGYEQAVATVTVTAPGGATPSVEFVGIVITSAGAVTGISIQEGGSGYAELLPTVTVTDPTGSGAVLTTTVTGDVVTAINIVNAGSGFTAPILAIIAAPTSGGAGATATATAGSNTFGTTPSDYNDVLTGQTTDAVLLDQITFVSDYFTSLGYNIRAQTNSDTVNTMQWQIIW